MLNFLKIFRISIFKYNCSFHNGTKFTDSNIIVNQISTYEYLQETMDLDFSRTFICLQIYCQILVGEFITI